MVQLINNTLSELLKLFAFIGYQVNVHKIKFVSGIQPMSHGHIFDKSTLY